MKQIGLASYQAIKTPPEWDEPGIDDFWDMFITEYDPKNELSDDDFELVRHWWYEFKGGQGYEWNDGIDITLEEMKEELKDLYETRGVRSCENCEKNGNCRVKDWCRISHNDDYTRTDFWQKKMTIEDWKKKAKEYEDLAGYWHDKYYSTREEADFVRNLLDDSQKERLVEWEKQNTKED